MIKFSCLIWVVLISNMLIGQVVFHEDFEDWHTTYTHHIWGDNLEPLNWTTTDRFIVETWGIDFRINRTSEFAYSGDYAAKISTSHFTHAGFPYSSGMVLGEIYIGNCCYGIPELNMSGVPFSARPTTFEGAYRYEGGDSSYINLPAIDSGYVVTYLFSGSDTIGVAEGRLPESEIFKHFSFPINYTDARIPDQAVIGLFVSNPQNNANYGIGIPGSTLWIDEIALTIGDPVGIDEANLLNELIVSPNPAIAYIDVLWKNNNQQKMKLELFNTMGQVVSHTEIDIGNLSERISVQHLSVGIYVLKVSVGPKHVSKKIFISSI